MKLILLLLSVSLYSCQSEKPQQVRLQKAASPKSYDFEKKGAVSMKADEFADFKQVDDEECTDEEEIEKKLLEKKKAFKLQGATDEDCAVQ